MSTFNRSVWELSDWSGEFKSVDYFEGNQLADMITPFFPYLSAFSLYAFIYSALPKINFPEHQ